MIQIKAYSSTIVSIALLVFLSSCGSVHDEDKSESSGESAVASFALRPFERIEDKSEEKLDKIARAHGMNRQTLVKLAKEDKRLKLDKEENLFYECPSIDDVNSEMGFQFLGHSHGGAEGRMELVNADQLSIQEMSILELEAFQLHSRPSAVKKIFLDFDGHTTTGSIWNSSKGIAAIVSPSYDKDGNKTAFSAAELADITAIWKAVAEDYALFNVDVTTADPGNAALTGNGIRVVIGGNSNEWYGGAGGVAYINSFGRANTPAFVFPKNLGPDFPKFVWEAVSHEVGHTLGLYHDGKLATATSAAQSYYAGQGDWASIMGVGYYKQLTQFDKGEFANANNKQDDIAVVNRFLSPVIDDFGNTLASASPINSSSINLSGLLSQRTDVDMFKFNLGSGPFSLNASGIPHWTTRAQANVNLQMTLFNAAGTAIGSSTPALINSVLNTNITVPGTYYLKLDGVGSGSPLTTGYSDYGSLGQYTLTGTAPVVNP